ncbi:MAG: hypothetical protein JWP58_3951 [Hymenobacter sp.]|nr:hypothetical protein [Hymenobacter sp.]
MLIQTVGQGQSPLIRPLLKLHETPARIYSGTNQQASLQLSYPHPASVISIPTIRFTKPNHQSHEFFNRINQPLTTPIHLFRISPLVAPKSPPTFAVPKRQTDQRKRQKHSLRQQIEKPGTPTEVRLSYPPQPGASIEIYFSNSLHQRKKPPYLCSPLQPEAART